MKQIIKLSATAHLILISLVASAGLSAPAVYAAPPAARSATVSGDVFLGGEYIELGLSQYGSFGTNANRPAGFFGTAARNNVGMSNDLDGFDTGTDWRMDFFLPGSPEARWAIGYRIGGTPFTAANARLSNVTEISNNTATDLTSGDLLKASSTGSHNSNLEITAVHEFNKSDKFFKTTVTLTNIHSTNILDDVRYMRSFDPDNTRDQGGSFTTQNTIVNTHAAGDGRAVVRADTSNNASDPVYLGTGGESGGTRSPILFYSSDTRARGSFHSSLVPGTVYTAAVYDSAQAKGSTEARDGAIAIAFDVGTLNPGQSQTFIYYTSLDNRDFSEVVVDIEENESGTPAVYTPGTTTTTDTTATITWITDLAASSQIEYGLVPAYGFTSTEINTSPRVTSHSIEITNLKACARYYYRTVSRTADSTVTNSDQATFTTTGCPTSSIVEGTQEVIATTGGNLSLSQGGSTAQLTMPNNFHNQSTQIQINRLESSSVANIPLNSGIAGNNIYDLIAVDTTNTQVTNFTQPITFTINYSSSLESDFDESTFDIYRYNGSGWDKRNCALDTTANTLTCTLNSFSVYALIGTRLNIPSGPPAPIITPACHASQPLYAPQLFQINSTNTTSTLYFTPPPDQVTGYIIEYGTSADKFDHATSFSHSDKSGAVPHTINNLQPNTNWNFRVRAQNDCAVGPWSNINTSYTGTLDTINSPTITIQNSSPPPSSITKVDNHTTTSPQCIHTVKVGDSLWEIAQQAYQDGNLYTNLIEDNLSSYPNIAQNINPGMNLKLRCSEPEVTLIDEPTPTETKPEKPRKAYNLNIKVKQNGTPVPNTTIQIPGTTLTATTDSNGQARITDVSGGKHQLSIVSKAYATEEDITVQGEDTEVDIAINVQVQQALLPNWAWLAIISILCIFILILLRRKRSNKAKNIQ